MSQRTFQIRDLTGALDQFTVAELPLARWLERVAVVFVILMAAFAPHSIAATQAAWLIGMLAWAIRCTIRPRPTVRLSAIGIGLVFLFVWTALSAVFSYEPGISLDKLRGVASFLVFIFVFNVAATRRLALLLVYVLIGSLMIGVAWTPVQKLIGRGVQVHGVKAGGLVERLRMTDGDAIVKANGRTVRRPEDVILEIERSGRADLVLNRLDAVFYGTVSTADLPIAGSAEERMGFQSWGSFRGFRATGLYSNFATFAEVLQLIGALAFGLLIAGIRAGAPRRNLILLTACLTAMWAALLLTVTRASQLGFMISSASSILIGGGRRLAFASVAIFVPLAAIGLVYLQQQRNVGFLDPNDGSIKYRQMMWRDGARLLAESPRHVTFGVGMDSIKNRWEEWGLFDKGHQPMGHFHSTPMQLAVERGVPALLIWIAVLGLCARTLWRGLRRADAADWRVRGTVLGCLAALIGFFVSGLVHYNLGDQEVAIVFYTLMALGARMAVEA